MNRAHLKSIFRGALRSLTVWTALLFAALPDLMPLVQSNFATFAPFIPASLHSRVLQVVAVIMLLLRLRTSTSLAQKGTTP